MQAVQPVAVVPTLYIAKIFVVSFAKGCYFFLCESKIRSNRTWIYHGVFHEVIQCRLRLIFFYRQDARDISKRNKTSCSRSFKEAAKERNIFFMGFFLLGCSAEHGIPFVNYNDKSVSGSLIYIVQRFGYGLCV